MTKTKQQNWLHQLIVAALICINKCNKHINVSRFEMKPCMWPGGWKVTVMTVTISFMQGLNLFCLDESLNSLSPFLSHPPSITIVMHIIMIPIIYSKSSVPFMSTSLLSLYLVHVMAFLSNSPFSFLFCITYLIIFLYFCLSSPSLSLCFSSSSVFLSLFQLSSLFFL